MSPCHSDPIQALQMLLMNSVLGAPKRYQISITNPYTPESINDAEHFGGVLQHALKAIPLFWFGYFIGLSLCSA